MTKFLNHPKIFSFCLVILINVIHYNKSFAQIPDGFEFTGTPLSGTLYGQAQINNIPASVNDWVAAFDEDGNCAGASQIIEFEGSAYINLAIYGDDATSSGIDEGISSGEQFFLRIYDASTMEYLEYQSPLNVIGFNGWYANNGAPMIGYDDSNTIYNWLTVDVDFDLGTPNICSTATPIDLENHVYPIGGIFEGPGVVDGIFDPSLVGEGTHVLTYEYSLSVFEYTVNVYEFNINLSIVNPLCNGDDNGNIGIINDGGFEPLINSFNGDLENLVAGFYEIIVTDNNGCVASSNAILEENDPLEQEIFTSDVLCNGDASGTAYSEITGGTGEYNIEWGEGINPDALIAGTYSVTGTDSNGCSSESVFEISEPEILSFEVVVEEINCAGENSGAISIEITGGYGSYITDWGGYDPNAIATGTYSLTVTDGNGCEISDSFEIIEPIALTSTHIVTNNTCYGDQAGSVEITPTGGTGDLDIEYLDFINSNNLIAGDYNYLISDDNGCMITESFSINQNDEIIMSYSANSVECHNEDNGSVQLDISGGVSPYETSWIGNIDPQNLVGGNHYVEITDSEGCASIYTITIDQPEPLNILVTSEVASCLTGTGSIDFDISGGTGNYIVNWNGIDLQNTPVGTHNYYVVDENGCTLEGSTTVYSPSGICGCTIPSASNYLAIATEYDGMCEFDNSGNVTNDNCPADINADGLIGLQDLLTLLAGYGTYCE